MRPTASSAAPSSSVVRVVPREVRTGVYYGVYYEGEGREEESPTNDRWVKMRSNSTRQS